MVRSFYIFDKQPRRGPLRTQVNLAAFEKEWTPALALEQRRFRNLRQGKHVRGDDRTRAARFLRHAESGISGGKEAVKALRSYVEKKITAEALCERINAGLAQTPISWRISVEVPPGRKRRPPSFTVDYDTGAATTAWKELVLLIEAGGSLARFRVCELPECRRLFYDDTQKGDKHHCTKEHKWCHHSRTHRRSDAYKQHQNKAREERQKERDFKAKMKKLI